MPKWPKERLLIMFCCQSLPGAILITDQEKPATHGSCEMEVGGENDKNLFDFMLASMTDAKIRYLFWNR